MRLFDMTENDVARMATDSPSTLVVMMYDAAIESLTDAAKAAEQGEIMARLDATTAVAEIVHQLQLALDLANGGEVAENLDRLYAFIISQLPLINLHNDAALAEQMIGLLEPLRQSWIELDILVQNGDVALSETDQPFAIMTPLKDLPRIASVG